MGTFEQQHKGEGIFESSSPKGKALTPMDEGRKGIRHRGEGAYLRCPVSTSVQFTICVCEGRESLRLNFF
jgi:hypothetical protein